MLTVMHNCTFDGAPPENTKVYGVAEVLRIAIEDVADDTLTVFYKKNAFDRRDLLKGLARQTLVEMGYDDSDIVVVARSSMDTDEKAILAGILTFAEVEVVARGA